MQSSRTSFRAASILPSPRTLAPLLVAALALALPACGGGGGGGGGGKGGGGGGTVQVLATDDATGQGAAWDIGQAITVDASGRLVVAGQALELFFDADAVVWRYTPTGLLDTSFGVGGRVVQSGIAGGTGVDSATDVAVDSTGRIIVTGGSEDTDFTANMFLMALLDDGSLDTSFGASGIVNFDGDPSGFDDAIGNGLALDGSGNIVVTGETYGGGGNWQDMAVWRFGPDGSADVTFGTGGLFTHHDAAGGSWDDVGQAVAIDSQGRIVVSGESESASLDTEMVVWRLTGSGALDATFGTGGFLVQGDLLGTFSDDSAPALAIDAGDRVIVVGGTESPNAGQKMTILRLDATGALDTTFGGGMGWYAHDASSGRAGLFYAVTFDALGRIVAAGARETKAGSSNLDLHLLRFGDDGTVLDESRKSGTKGGGAIDLPQGVFPDPIGGVYVTGVTDDKQGDLDMALWRLAE